MSITRRALWSKAAAILGGMGLIGKAKEPDRRLGMAELPPVGTVKTPRRRYPVPPVLRYENEQGERWIPGPGYYEPADVPAGFIYMFTQFPNELREHWYRNHESLGSVNAGWSEDLVLAMANDGYRLTEAILIAANMCERCINAACYDYGLSDSYPRDSERFRKTPSRCEFCESPEDIRRRKQSALMDERHEAVGSLKIDAEFVQPPEVEYFDDKCQITGLTPRQDFFIDAEGNKTL